MNDEETSKRPRSLRRRIARLLILIAIIYAGWCTLLYFMQDKMMFPRHVTSEPTPEEIIPSTVNRLWIDTNAGTRTEAWLLLARVEPGVKAPAVVFAHGNAELIDDCLGEAGRWAMRGYHVLLCEYRGYGRSGGRPSQSGITADITAFYDILAKRDDVDATRIYAHGRSLGAAVAAQLASKRPVAGLVLESPFSSATSFALRLGAPPPLVKSPFRTDRVLRNIDAPVIILHSVEDEVIPISHGRKLKTIRPDATLIELAGGHNSGLSNRPAYWEGIDRWLDENENR